MKQITIVILILILLPLVPMTAQENSFDSDTLLKELLRNVEEESRVAMALWLPANMWDQLSEEMSEEGTQYIVTLKNWHIFIILEVTGSGDKEDISVLTETEALEQITLRASKTGSHRPLPPEKYPDDLARITEELKTSLTQDDSDLLNKNIIVLVFPAVSDAGTAIAEADKPGEVSLWLGERKLHTWELPIPSLAETGSDQGAGQTE